MLVYYKLQKEGKDFDFNKIRFWKNKIESNDIFPCYPEQDFFEILAQEKFQLVKISNNQNYIININSLGPEGTCEIKFHNVNDVFDYFVVCSYDPILKEEEPKIVPKSDWFFFYLDQSNFSINNVQKESCTVLYSLDQWMTFGVMFHWFLRDINPQVKFIRKFKNRFICNKSYISPEENNSKKINKNENSKN